MSDQPTRATRRPRRGFKELGLLAWIEQWTSLTPTGVGVIVAALGMLALGQQLGNRSLFLLVYGAFGVIGMAFILGRRRLQVETKRSELPGRAREGQALDVSLEVTATRRVSTIVLEEVMSEALGPSRRLAVPSLPTGELLEHQYTFVPKRRGVYTVGPLLAEWSDPFGLTRRHAVLHEAVDLIVHPTVETSRDRVNKRAWEDPPVRPRQSRPWPSGFDFYGMRDYVHGDDPRRIVWSATARTLDLENRTGRYLVWEAEQGVTDEVNILLDTFADHHDGGSPSDTFETAVRAAATVASEHLNNGFSVSLFTGEGAIKQHLRGRRHSMTLMDELAAVAESKASLTDGVERLFASGNRNSHDVVITPGLDAKSASRLRLMMEQGTSMTLVLIVTQETDPLVLHRAGSLGCQVVELVPGRPFGPAFRHVVGAGRS